MSESNGCSVVVVVMIAVLMLIIGVVAGGGGAYLYLTQAGEGVPIPTSDEPVDTQPDKKKQAARKPSPEDAVLYPLDQTLRIEGPLPKAEVADKLLDERFKLRKCYQQALANDPELKGEMSLQFTVAGSNGNVTAAVERHTEFPDEGVSKCILDEIKSWSFSEELGSQSVVKFDILMLSMTGAIGEK